MQLKVARLKVIIAPIIIITFLIIIFIVIIISITFLIIMDIAIIITITFLRWENCMQLCRLRKDWFEVLAGLLLSSKLPRLRISKGDYSMRISRGDNR